MNAPSFFILLLCVFPTLAPLHAQTRSTAAALVPANFQPVTDSLGFMWDINQGGAINQGTNCFSGGMTLLINNNEFTAQQPMMSADGSEYFLTGNLNGIEVQRRVKVDVKNAFCRYFETLRNSSGQPQTFTLQIRVQFNNRIQALLSDTGGNNPTTLGPKETGVLATRPPNYSPPPPSVAWMLAGPGAKLRPSLRNEGNYRLFASFPMNLAPGESVSLVHTVAQRHYSGGMDAKSLLALFAPLKSPRILADVSARDRKGLLNFRTSGLRAGTATADIAPMLEKLGVERGATDVLAIGADTRLRGTASCAALKVQTHLGVVELPFERVAALLGGPRDGRVILRDGQVLTGELTAKELSFTMATGASVELNVAALDRLVMRLSADELQPAATGSAFIETFEGDRLLVKLDPSLRLRANTAWGVREFGFEELTSAGPSEENALGFFIALKDGSRFIALLDGDGLQFETALFGTKTFAPSAIRSIAVPQPKTADDEEEDQPERSHLALAGGQLLTGQIDLAELHFVSPGGVIPVPPNLLRTLQNTSDDASAESPIFTAELWGGGAVAGTLREGVLPVRTADTVLHVPVREITGAFVPSPAMPQGLRDKIASLVRDLGHPEWEKREAASRELGELGAMTRPQLEEVVKQTADAEVRRRAQAILDEVEL